MRLISVIAALLLSAGALAQDAAPPVYLYNIAVFEGANTAVVWRVSYVDGAACEAAKSSAFIRTIPVDTGAPAPPAASAKELVACSESAEFPLSLGIGTIPIQQLGDQGGEGG